MSIQRITVYAIILLGGLATAWLSVEERKEVLNIERRGNQVFVDGKPAPALSGVPFHKSYIDDATCLTCHKNGRKLDIMGQTYIAPKIKHDVRKKCTSCHALPA